MARVVVTAGKDYLDADAYGGIVAYAELLQLLGRDALATSSAPCNTSVTSSLEAPKAVFSRSYVPLPSDTYVIIDLSNPDFFDTFVSEDKVVEIIDHHTGHEAYWQNIIGDDAHIEFIGAACTLVFERWQKAGKLAQMSRESAKLLAAGIVDNTLNFKAKLTTQRDQEAYKLLQVHAQLGHNWAEEYLADCQDQLLQNFSDGLAKDTKKIVYPSVTYETAIGQLAVLDAPKVLEQHKEIVAKQLSGASKYWYMNLLDLRRGASCFYTTNKTVQTWLANLLGLRFVDNIAIADRLWLRKEIYRKVLHEKDRSK